MSNPRGRPTGSQTPNEYMFIYQAVTATSRRPLPPDVEDLACIAEQLREQINKRTGSYGFGKLAAIELAYVLARFLVTYDDDWNGYTGGRQTADRVAPGTSRVNGRKRITPA